MFKKKWIWIVALFLVVNIVGLSKIISILEYKNGIVSKPHSWFCLSSIGNIRNLIWPVKKVIEEITSIGFRVKNIEPETYDGSMAIKVELSQDVDLDKIKGYIDISPKIDFYIEKYYDGVMLRGDFIPGNTYTVEILRWMPSKEGATTIDTTKKAIVIPDYETSFKFKVPGMYMSLKGNQNIPIEAVNVDKIKVKVHRVYDNNIVYLLNNTGYRGIPEDIGLDVVEKDINTNCERNKTKEVLLDLKEMIKGDTRGIFFMTLNETGEDHWAEDSKLILTTDIGIVAKQSDTDLFVWLNSLSDTSSIAGATVKVFSKTNQQILEGVTDKDGIVHFKDVNWSGDRKPYVIAASKDGDLSFIELEKCTLAETDFNVQGRPYLSSGYEGFVYTDRGIYRPGEKIHLRAVLRDIDQQTPESFPIVFEIMRPDERLFTKLNGVLSKFGTVDIDVDIPDYALTGGYTANLMLPGSKQVIGSVKFNVEEFMPDRIRVNVNIPDKRFNVQESVPIGIKAEQFFGAPASGRQVSVVYTLRPVEFKPEGYKNYSFTDTTKDFAVKTTSVGEDTSNVEGAANFELKFPEGLQPPSALSCEISATVKELGGRAVTAHIDRSVDAYPYYIGIRQAKEGYISPNSDAEFNYVVLSNDGKKIDVPELEVNVCKVIYNNVLKKDDKGEYRYISERKEESIFKDTIKQGNDSGSFSYKPKSWGDYVIRIKGKDKISHTASVGFYCSDSGYMPWAMERPDRLELKLDKTSYAPGEIANLSIKSPFKGKALITISQDKVISVKVIDLQNETQEVPIQVEEMFAPNAYCAVTVIRQVDPDKDWISYRAYGIIPITLDNSNHKIKVNISVPQSASPKETVKLNIEVQGQEQAELSVALVDEGVLRLTGFKTPDPFEFFYGKRGNNIATSDIYSLLIPEFGKKKIGADSTPGGDKNPTYDPKKHLNPISAQRVKPIVLWKSSIVTDKDGKATAEFKIPAFSGNLKVMIVAVANNNFGNAQEDIKITEPLMIKPTLPRVLSVGDEFILPVSIFNSTGKDGEVAVSLEPSEGFVVSGGKTFNLSIKDGKEGIASFKLKAPPSPQKAEIKIKASGIGYATDSITELAVRPPVPFTTMTGSGAIKAPGSQNIGIPGSWFKGTEKYNLVVTSFPALQFAGGLKYLMQYPYGCVEQTTSCSFPLLYLKDIAALIDSKKYSSAQVDSYIDAGITRVLAMQTYSGGFGFWPGDRSTYDWGSVYATDFLVEADRAGYAVPTFAKDVALDYCEKILAGKDEDNPLDLKAYSCFVLAKAGRIKSPWIRRLQELKDKLPEYSKFHLAAALYSLGDKKAVSDILGQGLSDKPIERQTGDSLNSYTKENAVALSIYMDIDPENPIVPVLVKRLQGSMKNGNWETTQDNAQALLALGKYAKFVRSQDTNYSGIVSVDKKTIAEFDNQKGVTIDSAVIGGKTAELSLQGKGIAYYYWSSEGVPLSGKVEEKDKGIKVRRSFFSRDGNSLDVNRIKQGEVIVVDIAIDTGLAYKNVLVEDLLPACFEIENPRIATSETIEWIKKDMFEPGHIDIRDDRLLLFTDLPGTSNMHYRYIVRAVTKGKFVLPAISASCMYNPSIVSVSGQGNVEVGD